MTENEILLNKNKIIKVVSSHIPALENKYGMVKKTVSGSKCYVQLSIYNRDTFNYDLAWFDSSCLALS